MNTTIKTATIFGGPLLAAAVLAGCATLTKGTDQMVSLDTPGFPASQCTLTSKAIGRRAVTTPATFQLPKSHFDIAVDCVNTCARGTGIISSNVEAMTAGNIVFGGVIGVGVDAASGAMNKYNEVNQVAMVADPQCTATQ
jgi:hypothetical protein